MRSLLVILFQVLLAALPAAAQEIDARVTVNHQKIQGTSTSVFETLEQTITDFLNERQWTALQFKKQERIACNFTITVNKYSEGEHFFECTLQVQATRPVYNASYTSTLFLFQDPAFNFTFQEFGQIDFRPDVIDDNLTAVLAYYVYLIIGLDMDAMSPLGGTEYLQVCQQITTNAQGLNQRGWKAFDDSKNRFAIITDLLDGGMSDYRQMFYKYYREGLDIMVENTDRGRAAITEAIEMLQNSHKNKTMSMLPQIFTEIKRDELVSIYQGHSAAKEKDRVYEILSGINPSYNTYWNKLKE